MAQLPPPPHDLQAAPHCCPVPVAGPCTSLSGAPLAAGLDKGQKEGLTSQPHVDGLGSCTGNKHGPGKAIPTWSGHIMVASRSYSLGGGTACSHLRVRQIHGWREGRWQPDTALDFGGKVAESSLVWTFFSQSIARQRCVWPTLLPLFTVCHVSHARIS